MISYAQNHEDVVLARLLTADRGTWVDVGAGHPVYESVTKHFSLRGWHGLNIEPLAHESGLLAADRPADTTLRLAIADEPGTVTLHAGPPENRGCSTLDDSLADGHRSRGEEWTTEEVPAARLDTVLAEQGIDAVDFLKVDVEGSERQVLGSIDWSRFTARVVVVEATRPGTTTPAHDEWEPILDAAGYRCALFDGLNRFYAQADDHEALTVLASPANVLDRFDPWPWVERVEQARLAATAARAELDALVGDLAALADEARRLGGVAENLPSAGSD